jgi:hypothetical protein
MALAGALCSLIVLFSPAVLGSAIPSLRGLEFGPENVAVYAGETTTLQCITDGVPSSNVRWYEFVLDSNGGLISDGGVILPSHPNADRYEIISPDSRTYSLRIRDINLNDAGLYQCIDSNAAPPSIVTRAAQLVVIAARPNCTASYPADGFTIEQQYHTVECVVYYKASPGIAPFMSWTGPGPYQSAILVTNTSVWSGLQFYINRDMAGQNWICKTNFTTAGFIAPDSAENAPTWTELSPSNQVFVYWGPGNVTAFPIQSSYEIGQTITCTADANPEATFIWQNIRTGEIIYGASFVTREDLVGYQLMRCTASNVLQGVTYNRDFFLDVYVNPPTTTPEPTTQSTTTEPPAWANCPDLTGRWEAVNPNASICITVDAADNGNLIGLYRNGSDTFWLQLTGKTRLGKYDESGFVVLWPSTSIGVTAFAVECYSCRGVDTLLVNGVSRTSKDSEFCASGGVVNDTPTYTFYRVPISWPCSSSVAQMQSSIDLALENGLHA